MAAFVQAMDGRDGAVALNVRQMLSPRREGSTRDSPEVTALIEASDVRRTPRMQQLGANPVDAELTNGVTSLVGGGEPLCLDTASKEHLRERLVIAEARVAAAASSKARAQHMAAHLRDMLSPQAIRSNSRTSLSPLRP